ncbi:MAG: hypothetical protein LBV74_01050 [Tannerella sp.]|jgi:hypothetical protein|nr:hypothetical protein [Tannerella sp.]
MDKLLEQIKKVLDTPDDKLDIASAAALLLKFSKNRILNENIIRRQNVGKLKYELRKYYDYHASEALRKEVATIETDAKIIVEETLPALEQKEQGPLNGLRPDHDRLPEEIKALAIENRNDYPRMRKLHEQLKLLANARPCDRYPLLQELKKLDSKVRENWDAYDAFIIPPVNSDEQQGNDGEAAQINEEEASPSAPVDAKKISAARKYLSDNKPKLATLKAQEDQTAYIALRDKMQERLSLLIQADAGISEEYLAELKAIGVDV